MNRDIGVIRPVVPRARVPRTIASAAAFAQAIAQRYAPQAVMVTRADLALAWQAPDEINYFTAAPRIEIAPVVTVQERNVFVSAAREVAAVPEAAQAGFGEAEASALFARLFSRQARVATFAAGPPPAPPAGATFASGLAHAPSAGVAPDPFFASPREPLERAAVVERSLPHPVVDDDAPVRLEAARRPEIVHRDDDWGTRPVLPPEPKPVTLPAPEIRRVAEQVMREIDHRITARRERLGKR